MHLSIKNNYALDDNETPNNPWQTPAEVLFLSFTDSDLSAMLGAYKARNFGFELRITPMQKLKHPLSIDLYIDEVAQYAKIIIIRALGGYDFWPYGIDEISRLCDERGIKLIIAAGCEASKSLIERSNINLEIAQNISQILSFGGVDNFGLCLDFAKEIIENKSLEIKPPKTIPNALVYKENNATNPYGKAAIIFYRAHYLANDIMPVNEMLKALKNEGLGAIAIMVNSQKDKNTIAFLEEELGKYKPDLVLDYTSFSAGFGKHPLCGLNVPILQCATANTKLEAWGKNRRGLSNTDLAMNVILPESDGRIFTRAISFKAEAKFDSATQFEHIIHMAEGSRIKYVAELAKNFIKLQKKPNQEKILALILSDYPDRSGRSGYAVGLDTPKSAKNILEILKNNNYNINGLDFSEQDFILALKENIIHYSKKEYLKHFNELSQDLQEEVINQWGAAPDNFDIKAFICGNALIALQPDRGSKGDRKASYHDAELAPCHEYLAFYFYIQDRKTDAIIHLGTHGNLEWLGGKAVALSKDCWPEVCIKTTPVIYPYIVSDPGEASQAKRRINAITISHLTPPLMKVDLSEDLLQIEALVDEYSNAEGLDNKRMKLLRDEIIDLARHNGFDDNDDNIMSRLETQLCDIKEQRIGNGLHIFGSPLIDEDIEKLHSSMGNDIAKEIEYEAFKNLINQCTNNENNALINALNGKYIYPSSGGSLYRGRTDVLPTGRNLITIDTRTIPTQTANKIGIRAANEFITKYVQDNGDYPKAVIFDLWGSATLRNGGDEIAQAFHLMGAKIIWDKATNRVTGFEIIDEKELKRPRIDVTLRISGMFRDMFENVINMFDDAVKAINGESLPRIFSNAPSEYGYGVKSLIDKNTFENIEEIGNNYIDNSQYIYGRDKFGESQKEELIKLIQDACAFIHVQDSRETDILSDADYLDAEGGLMAAAKSLGNDIKPYHIDTSNIENIKIRTLAEEISLILHARAMNEAWIKGQMKHSYSGALNMANVVDQLFGFAATTDCVKSRQFELLFQKYMLDEEIRKFIENNNIEAYEAMKERFKAAINRGFWKPLLNSVWEVLG